jgi:hypothetical protein
MWVIASETAGLVVKVFVRGVILTTMTKVVLQCSLRNTMEYDAEINVGVGETRGRLRV